MEEKTVLTQYASLPPNAQQQVRDFIRFLQSQYQSASLIRVRPIKKLADEEFIGMWKNRADMQDSTAWVRETRKTQWRQTGQQ